MLFFAIFGRLISAAEHWEHPYRILYRLQQRRGCKLGFLEFILSCNMNTDSSDFFFFCLLNHLYKYNGTFCMNHKGKAGGERWREQGARWRRELKVYFPLKQLHSLQTLFSLCFKRLSGFQGFQNRHTHKHTHPWLCWMRVCVCENSSVVLPLICSSNQEARGMRGGREKKKKGGITGEKGKRTVELIFSVCVWEIEGKRERAKGLSGEQAGRLLITRTQILKHKWQSQLVSRLFCGWLFTGCLPCC